MNVYEGRYIDPGGRFAIVASRFNDAIVKELVEGCVDAFRRHGIDGDRVDLYWVPGAFELAPVARRLAESGRVAAVVVLGAVIRGATSHYDHVTNAATAGAASVSADTGIPVLFGLLTTETIEQAHERAGTKAGNHGFKAAMAAIEMASLYNAMGA